MTYHDRRCEACGAEYEMCECGPGEEEPEVVDQSVPEMVEAPGSISPQHGGTTGKKRDGLSRAEYARRGQLIAAAVSEGHPIGFTDGDPVRMLQAAVAVLRRGRRR